MDPPAARKWCPGLAPKCPACHVRFTIRKQAAPCSQQRLTLSQCQAPHSLTQCSSSKQPSMLWNEAVKSHMHQPEGMSMVVTVKRLLLLPGDLRLWPLLGRLTFAGLPP